jgi:hypothetical protein
MSQIRITRQRRTSNVRRRGRGEPLLPLDPRDPDITRAKQRQRQLRRPARARLCGDELPATRAEMSPWACTLRRDEM